MIGGQDHDNLIIPWEDFCASRAEYLTTLAITVAQGVQRRDTVHSAFCGCIDWHSCVHGVYALITASRLTGDPQWNEIAGSRLSPDKLADELTSLERGDLDHELPYGFSWLLKLAQERERWSGETDLLPLASNVAKRLESWVFSLSPEKILHHSRHRAYGNLSWAVLNLYDWAQFRKDMTHAERLRTFTRDRLLPLDVVIPSSRDEEPVEFFPASLHRSRALLAALPKEEATEWVNSFYQEEFHIEPVTSPSTPHSAGLNFSRSWGLWDLWLQTGDTHFRDLYVRHIVTHIELPQFWRDDYRLYSHWVAQFGIYAIALSMDHHTP